VFVPEKFLKADLVFGKLKGGQNGLNLMALRPFLQSA